MVLACDKVRDAPKSVNSMILSGFQASMNDRPLVIVLAMETSRIGGHNLGLSHN